MFPENELSDPAHIAGFSFPVKTTAPEDRFQDWEMGGIALNNPSQGLLVQLWKFTLEVDEETGDSSVYVEAPAVPKTLLFTGMNISEIAGAFDQNMHPFVAYMQSGAPKFWWWDPTAAAQVHDDLPSGCFDLRCALDDKRSFNVADSDIILSYVRGGSLYYRLQRERYADEHLLQADITRLVCCGMNQKSCFQWRAYGSGEGLFTDPYLGDILYDYCRLAGYAPEEIDVSEMYGPGFQVPGIVVDSNEGLDQPIAALLEMFPVFRVDIGRKTVFKRMGGPVVARIPFTKLVDDFPKTFKKVEKDRGKLPRGVQINHIDPDGGFAKNFQRAVRRTNMPIGSAMKTITTKVVMTADQVATAAWRRLKKYHNELYDYEFSTRLEYTFLVPGDVIEVEDSDGSWYRMHIKERNEDDGNIAWECEQDGGYLVYEGATVPGKPLEPPVSTTPGTIGETELDIFNLPVNRDPDDELVLYIGARGGGSGWNGAALYGSPDGVVPYVDTGYSIDVAANIGETLTAVTNSSTSVEVLMPEPLESVSPGQLAAGFNRFIIGDEEVQVLTATLLGMVDGLYHYSLSGMVRGALHMTKEPWAAGIRFAEFNDALIAIKVQRSYYGSELFYKGVSFGTSIDDATALSYDFDFAWSQYEFPVTNVVVVAAEGGGVKVTWDGSPRLGTFGPSPFHSKYWRGYRVKFADGHTIDTLAEEVTYPAGLMGTVVEVRALNEITGEGPLADGEGDVDPGDIPGFLFSGSFTDGYVGEAMELNNGEGFTASGGFWDASARGFVVPGVGAKCVDRTSLAGTRICGIPHEAGTFTSKVRLEASSPDPAESGQQDINQSVTIYPRRTHGALDLRFKQYQFGARMMVTTPPMKKFQFDGAGGLFFFGTTTEKVWGQFRVTGATSPFIVGINNSKGELTIGDYTVSIGPFDDAVYALGTNATYSIELDGVTGNWWIYEDTGSGPVLKNSGNLPLAPGKFYRIGITTEYVQSFIVEANGGNEAPYTAVTQVGHTGIPVPVTPIPMAWGYVEPDYAASFNGNGAAGATYADGFANNALAKSNAAYSSGKHRWLMLGGLDNGICVDAFTLADGRLGSAGAPDSLGVSKSTTTFNGVTVNRCFGGVHTTSELTLPSLFPQIIFALDADADTLKVCAYDSTGAGVVVLDTFALPAGRTWRAAMTGHPISAEIKTDLPGPVGYANAVVP